MGREYIAPRRRATEALARPRIAPTLHNQLSGARGAPGAGRRRRTQRVGTASTGRTRGGTAVCARGDEGLARRAEISRLSWKRLWASPLASTYVESDIDALGRLYHLRDERSRSFRAARRVRLVAGSNGQPRLSPLIGYIAGLDAAGWRGIVQLSPGCLKDQAAAVHRHHDKPDYCDVDQT